MVTNKESEKRCKVIATRVKPQQLAVARQNFLVSLPILPVSLGLGGPSALSKRGTTELSRPCSKKAPVLPPVCVRLDEGAATINGRKFTIPAGVGGAVTGKTLKEIAGIYRGSLLFIRVNGGMQRVRDKQTVELIEGTEFRHERPPAPAFSSISTLSRD